MEKKLKKKLKKVDARLEWLETMVLLLKSDSNAEEEERQELINKDDSLRYDMHKLLTSQEYRLSVALLIHEGSRRDTAKYLKISERNLYRLIKKYNITTSVKLDLDGIVATRNVV